MLESMYKIEIIKMGFAHVGTRFYDHFFLHKYIAKKDVLSKTRIVR